MLATSEPARATSTQTLWFWDLTGPVVPQGFVLVGVNQEEPRVVMAHLGFRVPSVCKDLGVPPL